MELFIYLMIALILRTVHGEECLMRKFDEDSFVCVCNSTYCDSLEIELADNGKFRMYTSTKSGQRLNTDVGIFEVTITPGIALTLNSTKKYQTIHGFGGAFTDSAGLNIKSLSESTQEQLIQSYFGRNGNRYSFGRVPVGGSDFSTRAYTLDDVPGDVELSNFSLAPEDRMYKIPYMKRALELNPDLKFLAGSWTAPPWMKTNDKYAGQDGYLKTKYYQTYADYLVKFLETYKNEGLPMWGITTGNEPADGYVPTFLLNNMIWTPDTVTKWVINNFGPSIKRSNSSATKILALDDQRWEIPWAIDDMYRENETIDEWIDGIALHWYFESLVSPTVLDQTHEKYPNKFLLMTEACTGIAPLEKNVVHLGDWKRAEQYIHSIIEGFWLHLVSDERYYVTNEYLFISSPWSQKGDMNHWMTGWIDWNLALDKNGGPNWIDNFVDSPIIVNPETDEFFKQPMYYAIAHVSKFVPPGSTRIHVSQAPKFESAAFLTPDNEIVVVMHNPTARDKDVSLTDPEKGTMNMILPAEAIRTVIYKQ